MNLDLQTIAQITGGRLCPAGAQGSVTGFSTDSRTLEDGELFIPLRGPNFDGHDFLVRALRRGAAACLSEEVIAGLQVPVIQVEDTLKALGDLAAAIRQKFSGPLVAVTGSSGKTTTKEMLASILALTAPGLRTEGNFNNLVGLPLTLFRLQPEHQWAVLEMGMSARGEIARLAQIAAPNIGVVTNVGAAHLDKLLGLDGVARAKGELFAALPPGGTAVINADDERVAQLPVANGVRRLLFGCSPQAQVRAEGVVVDPEGLSFELLLPDGTFAVRMTVTGRHNLSNALAAATAAFAMGVDGTAIVRGLEGFRGGRGRMELIKLGGGVQLLDDTYNANPLSVKAALTALDELGGEGRRIAVLGDMLELGESAAALHREVGTAAEAWVDTLVLLGSMAEETASGARQAGMKDEQIWIVSSHEQALDRLRMVLRSGDRVLVKGSRGMKMERITQPMREQESCLAAGNC